MPTITIELEYPDWNYPVTLPYKWMVNDLFRGVYAQQNYLVALGLFSYSEAIGRMILGTIGINKKGFGLNAFREFTEKYVGYKFKDDAEWYTLFERYRNGLVHQYYIKSMGAIIYNDDGTAPCGIKVSGQTLELRIHSYFNHFVIGLKMQWIAMCFHSKLLEHQI